MRRNWKVVGHCPTCGAPIWADYHPRKIMAPSSRHSCACRLGGPGPGIRIDHRPWPHEGASAGSTKATEDSRGRPNDRRHS